MCRTRPLSLAGLLLLVLGSAGHAQEPVAPTAGVKSHGAWAVHSLAAPPDARLEAPARLPYLAAEPGSVSAPSLSGHVSVGAAAGAVAGALFGLAVISIADCGGPGCNQERILGLIGTTAAGAAVGALGGVLVYAVRAAAGR